MSMPKVLLVDDTKLFLEVEKEFLRKSALSVSTATNGLEALKSIQEERPDLIFMDLHMPEMDGAECCRRIKGDPALKSIPVILVITEGKQADLAACRASGCNAVITKPIDRLAFLETGHRFLSRIDRREERIPCRSTVVFSLHEESYYGTSEDLSALGIYIGGECAVRKEDRLDVSFVLPGESSALVEAWGRVAWVNPRESRVKPSLPPGFGFQFLEMTSESRDQLRRFLDRSIFSGVAER